MNFPAKGDYIDIHNHGSSQVPGIFTVENLIAGEGKTPVPLTGIVYTAGIHPWQLSRENFSSQLQFVRSMAGYSNVIAVGEAGFDRLKGAPAELQEAAFEEQVKIAREHSKPVFIHCVRAWDELLSVRKRLGENEPWIVHGFRGKKELAYQLISKNMFISFWFDFIIRPESSELIGSLPVERIFLETDGSGEDIRLIYNKVAADLRITVDDLKDQIFENYKRNFGN